MQFIRTASHTSIVQEPQRPVILVHGILGQRQIYWNILKRRLERWGFRYHDCILPYGMVGDIRLAAGVLRDKVEVTLLGDDAEKVDLVCHSAGGLVARYYMMYLGGAKDVNTIVTMGTPHQGTYFAYVIGVPHVVPIARQTRPGSHFLDEINGPGAVPVGVKFYNIWSPVDAVVVPSINSKLPGSIAVRVPLTSHWAFLWRPDIHDIVRAALLGIVDANGKPKVDPPANILAAINPFA